MLITGAVTVLAVIELTKIDCVERTEGITDVVAKEATVDVNC